MGHLARYGTSISRDTGAEVLPHQPAGRPSASSSYFPTRPALATTVT